MQKLSGFLVWLSIVLTGVASAYLLIVVLGSVATYGLSALRQLLR